MLKLKQAVLLSRHILFWQCSLRASPWVSAAAAADMRLPKLRCMFPAISAACSIVFLKMASQQGRTSLVGAASSRRSQHRHGPSGS